MAVYGNVPVIQGYDPRPGAYGQSANQLVTYYNAVAQDEFVRTGSARTAQALNTASIRYTPEGTAAKGNITNEAVENALGYAASDIRAFDRNGDMALDRREVHAAFMAPAMPKILQLGLIARHPQVPPQMRYTAAYQQMALMHAITGKTANYIASVDVADANGFRDQRISAGEAAAKLLFDDTALQMFNDNAVAYQTVLNGLQQKTDYTGPSFDQLNRHINGIAQQNPFQTPFTLDGQLTAAERAIGDALTDAPIPTNQVVSQIHQSLNLDQRAAQYR